MTLAFIFTDACKVVQNTFVRFENTTRLKNLEFLVKLQLEKIDRFDNLKIFGAQN